MKTANEFAVEYVLNNADWTAKYYAESKAKFMASIDKNPEHAMGWSQGFFEETAKAQVWAEVAAYLRHKQAGEETLNELVKELTRRVFNHYDNSNIMKDCVQYAERKVLLSLMAAVENGPVRQQREIEQPAREAAAAEAKAIADAKALLKAKRLAAKV